MPYGATQVNTENLRNGILPRYVQKHNLRKRLHFWVTNTAQLALFVVEIELLALAEIEEHDVCIQVPSRKVFVPP